VIAGSSNFTAAGLTTNLELKLGQYQPSVAGQVETWFEELWADAVPYDLTALYATRYVEYEPYLVYLRVLWERSGAELAREATPSGRIHLTRFQTDGLDHARRILERYRGVLIADSVGLGKSFLAGELLTDITNAAPNSHNYPASARSVLVGSRKEPLQEREEPWRYEVPESQHHPVDHQSHAQKPQREHMIEMFHRLKECQR
jgi:hypothetical protein